MAEAGVFDRALADVLAAYLRKAFLGWLLNRTGRPKKTRYCYVTLRPFFAAHLITQERGDLCLT